MNGRQLLAQREQPWKGLTQVRKRVDSQMLAGTDDGIKHRRRPPAHFAPDDAPRVPPKGDRAKLSLGEIVVHGQEAALQAPLVRLPGVGWKVDEWHHVVLTFKNLDTGKPDAVTSLYIDGKLIGEVKDQAIAMAWDIEKAGVYLSLGYVGLLDEFALFDRALKAEDVALLHKKPDLLTTLKKH